MNVKSRRIGELSLGHAVNAVFDWVFNYPLYIGMVWFFGAIVGGGIMMLLSFITCYGFLKWYDHMKRDWLGIEAIKSLKDLDDRSNWWARLIGKLLACSDPVAIAVLSIKTDPFMTVAYMRHGANKYNGMTGRDWMIFVSSWFIGNLYWIVVIELGIDIFGGVLHYVRGVMDSLSAIPFEITSLIVLTLVVALSVSLAILIKRRERK